MGVQCISILGYIYQGAAFHAKQISKAVIRTSSERTVRITAITMHLGSSPPGFESAWFYFFRHCRLLLGYIYHAAASTWQQRAK